MWWEGAGIGGIDGDWWMGIGGSVGDGVCVCLSRGGVMFYVCT